MDRRYLDELDEYSSKIQFMVDWMDSRGYLEEHCFTFPDGDTWWATGTPDWKLSRGEKE